MVLSKIALCSFYKNWRYFRGQVLFICQIYTIKRELKIKFYSGKDYIIYFHGYSTKNRDYPVEIHFQLIWGE